MQGYPSSGVICRDAMMNWNDQDRSSVVTLSAAKVSLDGSTDASPFAALRAAALCAQHDMTGCGWEISLSPSLPRLTRKDTESFMQQTTRQPLLNTTRLLYAPSLVPASLIPTQLPVALT